MATGRRAAGGTKRRQAASSRMGGSLLANSRGDLFVREGSALRRHGPDHRGPNGKDRGGEGRRYKGTRLNILAQIESVELRVAMQGRMSSFRSLWVEARARVAQDNVQHFHRPSIAIYLFIHSFVCLYVYLFLILFWISFSHLLSFFISIHSFFCKIV